MRNLLGRFRFGFWCACLLLASATAQAEQGALYSLKAVKINPTCTAGDPSLIGEVCAGDRQCDTGALTFDGQCGGDITPTNTVLANPGDIIVAEIYGSSWSPVGQRLRSFQIGIDEAGYTSGGGKILPLGWDDPPDGIWCEEVADCPSGMRCDIEVEKCKAIACDFNSDCPPEYPLCQLVGTCTGANHDPAKGGFGDLWRFDERDWIFQGCNVLGGVDTSTLGYRYAWVINDSLSCAPLYTGSPKYFGTLALVVPDNACGIFTIPFLPSPDTVMFDLVPLPIEPLKTESLTIEMPSICPCFLAGSTPPNCALDGRQPSEPDSSSPAGWSQMQLEFDRPCNSCGFDTDRFSVRQLPGLGFPPISVSAVECTGLYTATITLSRTISTNTWTCVRDVESGDDVCVGYLPGDSDGDSWSREVDLDYLIGCLDPDRDPPCEIHECDMDRSGLCGPADILREIDLLNGAEMFDPPWMDQKILRFGNLAPCPSQ